MFKKIASLITYFLAGSVLVFSSTASALIDGVNVNGIASQTGIVKIRAFDGPTAGGQCSGTILYSSRSLNLTWLVTAAHCFSNRDDLFFVHSHFTNPLASIISPRTTNVANSRVFVHPDWLANGGHTSWFGPVDIAFVTINEFFPVLNTTGDEIDEYRRAIYIGAPEQLADNHAVSPNRRNALCGYGPTFTQRCGFTNTFNYYSDFRSEFFHIPRSSFNGSWGFEGGDSGGPFLKFAPGTTFNSFGGSLSQTTPTLAKHGVVAAVLQGPLVYPSAFPHLIFVTDPGDAIGSRMANARAWLASIPGSFVIPRITTWADDTAQRQCPNCVNFPLRVFEGTNWYRNAGWCSHSGSQLLTGDFNRDGRDDLLCHDDRGRKWIDYANARGEFEGTDWYRNAGWCTGSAELHIGDFNGDNRDDMLCHGSTGNKWIDYADSSGRFLGTDWQRTTNWCSHTGAKIYIGDFNGDEHDDMLCHDNAGSMWVDRADAFGRFYGSDWSYSASWCIGNAKLLIGKFNEDNRDDLLCHGVGGNKAIDYASVNGQFIGSDWSRTTNWCSHSGAEVHTGDFNGDGRTDMLCHDGAGNKWVDFANNLGQFLGTDWQRDSGWCSHAGSELHIGRFNSDLSSDMLCHDSIGRKWIDYAN